MRAKLLPGTARLIGRQRARIPKRFLLSPAKAALYAAGAAATVLLASVDTFGGALALGWFAGLGYARQNMLVTAHFSYSAKSSDVSASVTISESLQLSALQWCLVRCIIKEY